MARDVFVQTSAQLNAALQELRPGDAVILKNGTWRDANLVVTRGGAPDNPVTIRAESPGGVILTGASVLALNAAYVTVDGLLFHGGTVTQNAVVQFNSHDGTLRNSAIVDCNPAAFGTRYYWVFFAGDHNLVDRCYFKGKNNLEPLIGNALEDSRHNSVTRSYFKNIPYVPNANGREIIRVWGSGKTDEHDDDGAYFTIEDNLFDHADGEGTEIISLKSNHNVVRHNTVVATRGGINIRRGNFNTVQGNVILGQGTDGAAGLRMSGRDNLVQGNFVSGCTYGIRVACGEYIADSLTAGYTPDVKPNGRKTGSVRIATYPQVVRLTLSRNVVTGCSGLDLEVGSDYKKHWPSSQQVLLPESCVIEDNTFVRPAGGTSVVFTVADHLPPLERFTFKPNHCSGNLLVRPKSAVPPAPDGFEARDLAVYSPAPQGIPGLEALTAEDVGPAWIIALRKAGDLSLETAAPGERPPTAVGHAKKKKPQT